jgi:hypothetical protein
MKGLLQGWDKVNKIKYVNFLRTQKDRLFLMEHSSPSSSHHNELIIDQFTKQAIPFANWLLIQMKTYSNYYLH